MFGKSFPIWCLGLFLAFATCATAGTIRIASTTSTQNSGLYDYLLPIFTERTGIKAEVIAVGTGQAIRIAKNGDADLLVVHHRPSEDAFIAEGYGTRREDIMYNDFVIIGPGHDPAQIRQAETAEAAFEWIADHGVTFISRGDDSGTHKKEQEIWAQTGFSPQSDWYREIGAGMGAALNMASAVDGYTLSDRGTWLSFGNKGALELLFSGDFGLRNPYGAIVLNPERYPHINHKDAQIFVDWLISTEGQNLIAAFTLEGKQLFCPNSNPQNSQAAQAVCPSDH